MVLLPGIHKNDEACIVVGDKTLPVRNVREVEFHVPSTFAANVHLFLITTGTLNLTGFVIPLAEEFQ